MLKGPIGFNFRKCIYLVGPVVLLRRRRGPEPYRDAGRAHGRASWNLKLVIGFDEWDLPKLSISVQDPGPSADELGEARAPWGDYVGAASPMKHQGRVPRWNQKIHCVQGKTISAPSSLTLCTV